jgi:hypothetical protein
MSVATTNLTTDLGDELLCSVCREPVRCAPPDYFLTSDPTRIPRYSHRDGTGLCWDPDGTRAAPRPREVRHVLPATGSATRVGAAA